MNQACGVLLSALDLTCCSVMFYKSLRNGPVLLSQNHTHQYSMVFTHLRLDLLRSWQVDTKLHTPKVEDVSSLFGAVTDAGVGGGGDSAWD